MSKSVIQRKFMRSVNLFNTGVNPHVQSQTCRSISIPVPAALPLEVLKQAQAELLDFKGTGMSVMEISHRSKEFEAVIQTAEADLRELLGIPANYKVMFLQGGASLQFAMLPMNLRPAGASADYIVTGTWSKTAIKEAKKLGTARAAANTEAGRFQLPARQP